MVYNFGAGPAMLPAAVVERIRDEFPDWQNGLSPLEISHRSAAFTEVTERAEENLRQLLQIPKNYQVLFVQGGSRAQFSMVPMNIAGQTDRAAYAITGIWSQIAYEDASQFVNIDICCSNADSEALSIPNEKTWYLNPEHNYLHYTDNETINGLEFARPPKTKATLVSDMSSSLLSKKIDVAKHGVIYACSQKNIGPAGLTIVIIDQSILKKAQPGTPLLYDYHSYIDSRSLINTPPTFIWYIIDLVLQWIVDEGGIAVIEKRNNKKAQKLYNFIDRSDFYNNRIDPQYRSRMNVPFQLADPQLDKTFLELAEKRGLMQLKGHRTVGGMRASLYNAMPEEGVDELIGFMSDFAAERG